MNEILLLLEGMIHGIKKTLKMSIFVFNFKIKCRRLIN
jgi:hypothetical protein